jgi:hypothetical protein
MAAFNEDGTSVAPAISARRSASWMRLSRRSASTNSRRYSGLPPACSAAACSRAPGGAPASRPVRSVTASWARGASDISTPSGSVMVRRSASTSGRRGTGRHDPASNRGSCPTSRRSRPHTARLISSAHCRSSRTSRTGEETHHRSMSMTSRSAAATTGSPEPTPTGLLRSRPVISASSGAASSRRIWSSSTHSGNRASDSSAAAHTVRTRGSVSANPARSSVDLPMPGSPSTHRTLPCPLPNSPHNLCITASSPARPTGISAAPVSSRTSNPPVPQAASYASAISTVTRRRPDSTLDR